ncbi:hypothetical protein ACXYTP_07330 [Tsukamurella ocularis]|uniref:hypothetical protein n=1 Tax=Tsukamurella ocularis TaxID=1970234 RepID=UPI0039EF1585
MNTTQLRPLPDWFGDVAHQAARIALIEEDMPADLLDSPEMHDALAGAARAAAAIVLDYLGHDYRTPVPDPWANAPHRAGFPVAREHENALQRDEPNPNSMALWDGRFIAHIDVEATELTGLRFRIRCAHRPRVQEFVRDHDGDLFAQWRGGAYRVTEVIAARGYLDLVLLPCVPVVDLGPGRMADLDTPGRRGKEASV